MPLPLFIEPQALKPLIGTADAPLIIDVRVNEDVADDPVLVPGARRMSHQDLPAILDAARHAARVVVLCQKGAKLSQGVAAALRWRGVPAQVLRGGTLGWVAAGGPVIPLAARAALPLVTALETPAALAALWTLHRWSTPEAEVWVVSEDAVEDVAQRFGGTAATPQAAEQLGLDLPAGLLGAIAGRRAAGLDPRAEVEAACALLDAAYAEQRA